MLRGHETQYRQNEHSIECVPLYFLGYLHQFEMLISEDHGESSSIPATFGATKFLPNRLLQDIPID